MNKSELRNSYVVAGWAVEAVAQWTKVSDIGGKAKYDVNVVSPGNDFFTAQVVVTDDGGPAENALAIGRWEARTPTFVDDLRTFLRGREDAIASVYAIAVKDVYEADEIAVVIVYSTGAGNVTAADYVVKRRSGAFDFQPIA